MEEQVKEVFYGQYCPECIHRAEAEDEDVCNECLSQPWNVNSHRPINYVKK